MAICLSILFLSLQLISTTKSQTLRLVNGTHPKEGRVEVLINSIWGTVCDDSWDLNDARVVCRQLFGDRGSSSTVKAYSSAFFGQGTVSQIWMDEVACTGTESRLVGCPANLFGRHDCGHNEDAGVSCDTTQDDCNSNPCHNGGTCIDRRGNFTCSCPRGTTGRLCDIDINECSSNPCQNGATCNDHINSYTCTCGSGFTGYHCFLSNSVTQGNLRLVNGAHPKEGRVEVLINGTWGTVCDNSWGLNDARVVCRQLFGNSDSPSTVKAYHRAFFGQGTSPDIWMDYVSCRGNESELINCPANVFGAVRCTHIEDAGVSCDTTQDECYSNPCQNGGYCYDRNGNFTCGCRSGTTGTMCEIDSIDDCANNACQNGATCNDLVGTYTCTCAAGFIGFYCNIIDGPDEGKVRLVNGAFHTEGRVEIFINGTWGVVCDDYWDSREATVVCRQLGFNTETVTSYSNVYFGRSSTSLAVLMDDVQCGGNETTLIDCKSNNIRNVYCYGNRGGGVSCGQSQGYIGSRGRLRLVNGSHPRDGRVEMQSSGRWGTVCDDSWSVSDATVVCRQLGYEQFTARAFHEAYFGQGNGTISLNGVMCRGSENILVNCITGSSVTTCTHNEDVGVLCDTSQEPGTLENCNLEIIPTNWSATLTCDAARLFSLDRRFEFSLKQYSERSGSRDYIFSGPYPLGPVTLYYNYTDNKQYYRGSIYRSIPLKPYSASSLEVAVDPSPTAVVLPLSIVQPQGPFHNCSSMYYISESGTPPCACATGSLGTPPGRLIWLLGNDTMTTGEYGVKELLFPFEKLTNQHDRMTAICRLDWIEPVDVVVAVMEIDTREKDALIWAAIGGGSMLGLVLIIGSIVLIVIVVKCRRGHNIVCCWRSPLNDIPVVNPRGSVDNIYEMNTGNNENNQGSSLYDIPVVKPPGSEDNFYEAMNTGSNANNQADQTTNADDEHVYANEALSHM